MKTKFRFYTDEDFSRVRSFILDSQAWGYQSWGISRFNFCCGFIPEFKGVHGIWQRSVGLWEDESGELTAVALNEGEGNGEAFFQFRNRSVITEELLEKMFFFAETHMGLCGDDRKTYTVNLRIPQDDQTIRQMAEKRGYAKTQNRERTLILPFKGSPFPVSLPDGFRIADGHETPALFLSLAHMHSFRYGLPHTQRGEKAFNALRRMGDWRPELDLCVLDREGRPAGLAIVWCDGQNKICELEPLGVVWWYRRLGLGKALIYEAANRVMSIGEYTGMVGGDQQFYWSLGFEPVFQYDIWTWHNN